MSYHISQYDVIESYDPSKDTVVIRRECFEVMALVYNGWRTVGICFDAIDAIILVLKEAKIFGVKGLNGAKAWVEKSNPDSSEFKIMAQPLGYKVSYHIGSFYELDCWGRGVSTN